VALSCLDRREAVLEVTRQRDAFSGNPNRSVEVNLRVVRRDSYHSNNIDNVKCQVPGALRSFVLPTKPAYKVPVVETCAQQHGRRAVGAILADRSGIRGWPRGSQGGQVQVDCRTTKLSIVLKKWKRLRRSATVGDPEPAPCQVNQ